MDVLLRGTVYHMEPGDTSAILAQEPSAPTQKKASDDAPDPFGALIFFLAGLLFLAVGKLKRGD